MNIHMSGAIAPTKLKAVAPMELDHCYFDFILSRQAMMVSEKTIRFYHMTAGKFVCWLIQHGKGDPGDISARDVRTYLNGYIEAGAKASYVHGHARAIRTFLRFLYEDTKIWTGSLPRFHNQAPNLASPAGRPLLWASQTS